MIDDRWKLHSWGHAPHVHDFHQFLHVAIGHAVVGVEGMAFRLSSSVGLMVPAGTWHSARFSDDCLIMPFAFPAGNALPYDGPTQIAITSERRHLLLAEGRRLLDDDGDGSRELFDALVDDLAELTVPAPVREPARAVAEAILADPADPSTVTDWAARSFVSPSSLRRAFRSETGLSFTEWRTRARINASIPMLERGEMVSLVAQRVGFASANGYILAFRRYFGQTPGVFVNSQRELVS
ncbi:MAG: AraC family transcriptional regulator [Nocardioidaceae bacterium]